MNAVILLAAGKGRRMAMDQNKIFLRLGPWTVLQWNLLHLAQWKHLSQLIVVASKEEVEEVKNDIDQIQSYVCQQVEDGANEYNFLSNVSVVIGGQERQDSVMNGMKALDKDVDIVLVHDGARPMAEPDLFNRVSISAKHYGAAVAAVPTTDTVKRVDENGDVIETLIRDELFNMQTPQGFQRDLFEEAIAYAKETGYLGTDDVSLVEHLGKKVHVVDSSYQNSKITTPNDVEVAKRYLGIQEGHMRVGMGYDIHQLKKGRPCILGGVKIDSPIGPDGHSDADVLIHALMDALLGAAGLHDIGYYFPPTDDAYKGISSMLLLEKVHDLLKKEGLKAYNIDIMVIAEAPKLMPHVNQMKENLSHALSIPLNRISVKATTNETLGAIGRREGIAAQAVVTLVEGEM